MGWMFSTNWSDRKSLIKHLTETETDENRTRTCLAHCLRGNVLWTVWEIQRTNGTVKRCIGCDLLQNGGANDGWGYKDMEESMGPYYYTCPLKYLGMVPEVACQEWRDLVIAKANLKSLQIHPGTLYELREGFLLKVIQITALIGKNDYVGKSREGKEFKIRRNYLTGATFVTWPEIS